MSLTVWMERKLRPGMVAARAAEMARDSPLVIMGRGKSGTRLLAWACQKLGFALGASEAVRTGDLDDRGFLRAVKGIARRSLAAPAGDALSPGDLALFQREAHRIGRILRKAPEAGAGWGWKWPETYLIAPYVHATFPRARFLHMVRDGRDLAFKHHLTDDPHRALGRALLRRVGALGQPHHLQAAQSWRYQVEAYRRYAERIPDPQRLEVTYEALCRDPLGQMGRIADFLEVPLSLASRDYAAGHFKEELVEAWRGEDPAQVREVEALIAPTLTALGYRLSSEA